MAKLNADSYSDIAVIYPMWGVLLLILAFARFARAAFRAGRGEMLSQIAKHLRLLSWGGAPVAGAVQPIDKLVKVIGGVRRTERITESLLWVHPVLVFTFAFHLCGWVFEWSPGSRTEYNLPSGNGIIEVLATARFATILMFTVTLGTVYYPAWATPLRFDFLHVLMTIACMVTIALQQSILQWFYHNLWVLIFRTGMCVVHGDNRVTIASNSVFSLAMLVTVQLRFGMTPDMVQMIMLPSIFICILSVIVERSRESELRATLEAKASKELETSVEAVLATICDAVVLLSSSFQLLRPSPHLAALLMRSSCSAVLMTGGNFVDLLVESDRDSFLQFMGGPSTHAKMLHAHMRDANSSAVNVHLYHTKYLDLEGQPVHIIGIREDSEENRQKPLLQELGSNLSRQVADEVWDRAHESTGSSISGSSDPMPLVDGDDAMSLRVWVDASSTDLMMVKCTPEFTTWSGPSGLNDGLLSWVVPLDQSDFYEFFHKALRYYVNCAQNGDESRGPFGSMRLELKPPLLGGSVEAEVEIVEICVGNNNNNDSNNNTNNNNSNSNHNNRSSGRTGGSFSEPRTLGCVSFKNVRKTRTTQKRSKRTSRTRMESSRVENIENCYFEGLYAAAAESTMARPSSFAVAASNAGSEDILRL
ncbi:unnamed protein product [Polarella glacialis]|uniref:Transmembrane protein n=1 Tax=Polarella glacialis TaxID=89957 RepID=A0A813D5W5_POLGL|nr:unnamed protein product [Polarella glacialis]